MQKILDKWNALTVPKQVGAILIFLLLGCTIYSSFMTVLVTPIIDHLQHDSHHAPYQKP